LQKNNKFYRYKKDGPLLIKIRVSYMKESNNYNNYHVYKKLNTLKNNIKRLFLNQIAKNNRKRMN